MTFLSDECEIKSYNYVREVLGPEQMDSVLICTFIEALAGLRHERLFEILDFVLHQKRYEQNNIMMCALKQMVKLPSITHGN